MICSNCHVREEYSKGICWACYLYYRNKNQQRPERLWLTPKLSRPKRAKKALCSNCTKFCFLLSKGECSTCYSYRKKMGNDRPEYLWSRHGRGSLCDCGKPAVHNVSIYVGSATSAARRVETMKLCSSCYEVESSL